jgi:hypothetical protein
VILGSCDSPHRGPPEESYNEEQCQGFFFRRGRVVLSVFHYVLFPSDPLMTPHHSILGSLHCSDTMSESIFDGKQIALGEDWLKCFLFHHRQMSHSSESQDDRMGERLEYEQFETEEQPRREKEGPSANK